MSRTSLYRSIARIVALAAMAAAVVSGAASTANAASADPKSGSKTAVLNDVPRAPGTSGVDTLGAGGPRYTALDEGEWSAGGGATWPETFCTINGSVLAFLAKIEQNDGSTVNGLVLQTHTDIHNPWVFVGCDLRVYVDVVDNSGITLKTFTHDSSAGPWIGGANNRTYTYHDSLILPQPKLDRIDHLRIRFSNV